MKLPASVVRENEWRSYRGPRASYLCTREIAGGAEAQGAVQAPADFVSDKGAVLKDWAQIDELGICARVPGKVVKDAVLWNGGAVEFVWPGRERGGGAFEAARDGTRMIPLLRWARMLTEGHTTNDQLWCHG